MLRRSFTDGRRPRLRRWRTAASLLLVALVSGACAGQGEGLKPPVNLQVLISSGRISERFNRVNLRKVVDSEVADFTRSNPSVSLHVRYVPEEEVLATLRKRADMGAGPDLMITRVPLALVMAKEKLSRPSGLTDRDLAPLRIRHLSDFRQGNRYTALPFLLQPNLACYNRRRLAKPPTSLAELQHLADEGHRIGLSLVLDQLSWTGTGLRAQDPLLQLFDTPPTQPRGRALLPADRQRVLAWLRWLYRANVNPNIQFFDTNEDLAERFTQRELDWISCNSAVVPILRQALGNDLGLALLPGESEQEPAWAVARLQMISFGRDSAPAQREAAENFALFLLNDYSQNVLMTRTEGVLPVNDNVIVPVKRSEQLAVMARSRAQAIVPSFSRAVGVRLERMPLMRLIKQNVYGEVPPEEVLTAIEALARQRAGVTPELAPAGLNQQ